MDGNWIPGFITGGLALIAVFVGGWLQSRRERQASDRQAKLALSQHSMTSASPTPPTTQEVWTRLDKVEKVLGSTVVLLGEVADQWQAEHPPVLSRRHVSIVAEAGYMPPEWDPQLD